jgi:hypothetical protein
MPSEYTPNVYSSHSKSNFPDVATSSELKALGFKQQGKNGTTFVHRKYPHLVFKLCTHTEFVRDRYRTYTLYRLVDMSVES